MDYSGYNWGQVTHVIFDVDGLLLDTESLYTKMMETIASRYGKQFSWDIKVKQMGKNQSDSGKIFIGELDLPITVEEYCIQINSLMEQYFPEAELMPGALRLVNHLHQHNIPMGVCTGSHENELKLKITKHKSLFSSFHPIVCSSSDSEVKKGKPAPDCFLVTARRFLEQPSVNKVLVFEDAPNGVLGALAAGMQVIWVPDSNCPDDQTIRSNPSVLRLKTLDEFVPELFGLPPYQQ